jgi:hypothetical protein
MTVVVYIAIAIVLTVGGETNIMHDKAVYKTEADCMVTQAKAQAVLEKSEAVLAFGLTCAPVKVTATRDLPAAPTQQQHTPPTRGMPSDPNGCNRMTVAACERMWI